MKELNHDVLKGIGKGAGRNLRLGMGEEEYRVVWALAARGLTHRV